MKTAIKKMIAEYEMKIGTCEKTLEMIREDNSVARRNGDKDLMEICRGERREWEARKGAYIQTKADIDSILDFV